MTKGDFKPYKKGFGYKRFNRLLKLQQKYMVLPNRPGWEQTPNGLMPPPTPITGIGGAFNSYWGLDIITSDDGDGKAVVKIKNPATIRKSMALDDSTVLTIQDINSSFTVESGDFLAIETNNDLTSVKLVKTSEWDGYPMPHVSVATVPPGKFVLDKYFFPLWKIIPIDSKTLNDITINDVIAAQFRGFNAHLKTRLEPAHDSSDRVFPAFNFYPAGAPDYS